MSKWTASEYLDDGRWGIVDQESRIIVRILAGLDKHQAETVAEAHNRYEAAEVPREDNG